MKLSTSNARITGKFVTDTGRYYRVIADDFSPAIVTPKRSWLRQSGWTVTCTDTGAAFKSILKSSVVKSVTELPEISNRRERICVIDGQNLIYRSYYGKLGNGLVGEDDFPISAIQGFIQKVCVLMEDDVQLVVVFDHKGKNFRHDLLQSLDVVYKENRKEMPEDLQRQLPIIHEFCKLMGFPVFMVPGWEADDIIATITWAHSDNYDCTVCSTDKDLMQLVSDSVSIFHPGDNRVLTETDVKDKMGVLPNQIVDYLMLVGDTSDNVPGVAKCGKVTASKWLDQYGDLQGVIDNADDIKGKVGENLRDHLPAFDVTRKIVHLGPVDVNVDLHVEMPDWGAISRLLKSVGMRTSWFNFKYRQS